MGFESQVENPGDEKWMREREREVGEGRGTEREREEREKVWLSQSQGRH